MGTGIKVKPIGTYVTESTVNAIIIWIGCLATYCRAYTIVLIWQWFVVPNMPNAPTITPAVATGLLLIWETMRLMQPIERAATLAKAFAKGEKTEPSTTAFKERAMYDSLLILGRFANTVSLFVSAYILHLAIG